jgi:hypothetical protein
MPNQDHIIRRWEIRITNKAGTKTEYLTSDSAQGVPHLIEFDIDRIGGCREFTMECDRRLFGAAAVGNLLEFWGETMNDAGTVKQALTRYWRGELEAVPGTGTTRESVTYKAVGLGNQLRKRHIITWFVGDTTGEVVKDLIAEISIDSDVSSATDQVAITGGYTTGDAEFELVTADDAIRILAEVQKDVDWGVDQDGKVYFKNVLATVVDKAFVGSHLYEYEPTMTGAELANQIIILSKEVVGGGMLILRPKDSTSVTAYRRKSILKEVPHLAEPADAWRIGEHLLATLKDPALEVEAIRVLSFAQFQFPRGRIEIVGEAGTVLASLPIQRVIYRLDGKGFFGTYEIGNRPPLTLTDQIRSIIRQIEVANQSSISTTRRVHTGIELFRRAVISDAKKQDNPNVFVATFEDMKTLDLRASSFLHKNTNGEFLGGTEITPFEISIPISNLIPGGRSTDTIRVHAFYTNYGTVDFQNEADLADFFEANADYRVKADTHLVENFQNGTVTTPLLYKVPSGYTLADWKDVWFRWAERAAVSSGNYYYFYLEFRDSTHWIRARFDTSGASGLTAWIQYQNGGAVQTSSSTSLVTAGDYRWLFQRRVSPTNTFLIAHSDDSLYTTITGGSISMDIAALGGSGIKKWGAGPMFASSVMLARLDWAGFDIGNGALLVRMDVSRDDGTTYTLASDIDSNRPGFLYPHGTIAGIIEHVNVTVSSQPSGSKIRLKGSILWPGRLYGWGASWKADA